MTGAAITGPGDEAGAARGRMRAARADREHAVELLKVAFVEERLTKDELDARVSQALAARTYADLAALTQDLPAAAAPALPATQAAPPPAADAPADGPAVKRAATPGRTLARGAAWAALSLTVGLALIGLVFLTGPSPFDLLAVWGVTLSVVAASGFLGYGIIDACQQWWDLHGGGPGGDGDGQGQPGGGPGRQPGQARRPGRDPGPAAGSPGQAEASRPAPRYPAAAGLLAGLVVNLGGRGILLHGVDPAQR